MENVDITLYPEFYRKSNDNIKGSNNDTAEPFLIALIEDMKKENKDIKLTARIFYRPENTGSSMFLSHTRDLNLVYYTDES